MDETLVKIQKNFSKLPHYDGSIRFKGYQNVDVKMLIMLRPDARKMLRRLAKEFELILFTSSIADYANSAIDFIEGKERFFEYRLTKIDCVGVPQINFHIKDLRVLTLQHTRDIKDIVLVDNQISNFMLQINNGIPVSEFNGDRND